MTFKHDIQKAHNINLVIAIATTLLIVLLRALYLGPEKVNWVLYGGILLITLSSYFLTRYVDRFMVGLLPLCFGLMNGLRIPFEGYLPEIHGLMLCSLLMTALYVSQRSLLTELAFLDGLLLFYMLAGVGKMELPAFTVGGMPVSLVYLLGLNGNGVLFLFLVRQVGKLRKQLENHIHAADHSCQELSLMEDELQARYDELQLTNEKLVDMNERFNLILEAANEAIFEWDMRRGLIFNSDKLHGVLGLDREIPLTARFLESILNPGEVERLKKELANTLGKREHFVSEVHLRPAPNVDRWIQVKAVIRDGEGRLNQKMVGTVLDITSQKKNEMTIRRLAFTDSVTGLPNREAILRKKGKLTADGYNGILITGLINFSDINANYGYEAGDRILKSIGMRLSDHLPEAVISRLRASDFAILVRGGLAGIQRTLDTLEKVFGEPFRTGTKDVHLKYNVGAALAGIHGEEYELMLKRANLALLEARRGGYEGIRIFEQNLEKTYEERIDMENDFHDAVLNQEIKVAFQPKFRTHGGLYGFEALARWERTDVGNISPEVFVSLAEETGLIVDMGLMIARRAFEFLVELTGMGVAPEGNISINISPVQLTEVDFVEKLVALARETGADVTHIGLEITESIFIGDKQTVIEKLERLRREGFKIYLDDFGKDYSNFSYLEDLPLDYIKIDKEFIKRLEREGNSKLIVKSIIDLTHSLGCRVVAEGVETERQLELLRDLNCDFVQGFLKGRPVCIADAYEIAKIG